MIFFFFFKRKTAYEMRISDWSSDVCSSDLRFPRNGFFMQVVIVEAPAKAKTIEKYLGRDFKVLASYGHVRDLPPKDGSVDPDDGFAMQWQLYPDKAKRLKEISDAAKQADRLVLATDPDREGEAISWHVQELLRSKKAQPIGRSGEHTSELQSL